MGVIWAPNIDFKHQTILGHRDNWFDIPLVVLQIWQDSKGTPREHNQAGLFDLESDGMKDMSDWNVSQPGHHGGSLVAL